MQSLIKQGNVYIGIEFGSTRIKSVLIAPNGEILAKGVFHWQSQFINDFWTYDKDLIWQGLQQAYASLANNVKQQYQCNIHSAKAIGISGMMHGYMPFDNNGNLLVPFRSWRNDVQAQTAHILTQLFQYNIPQRWSIAHLYQAIVNQEPHLAYVDYLTTLSGYIHWQLTGERVLGIGDASGMFPIDLVQQNYNAKMQQQFNWLVAKQQLPWKIEQILPKVLVAGQNAGKLTEYGAKLLDPTGNLQPNIPFCPPESDACTGMVATNSIQAIKGNISTGTSAFAMIVLAKPLSKIYPQLDLVTTPTGKQVVMVHSNNCSSDINAWLSLFNECLTLFDCEVDNTELYNKLFEKALEGEDDSGGLLSYGFYTGEHLLNLTSAYPILLRPNNAKFTLANLMRTHIYSAFAVMKIGLDLLQQSEQVKISEILAHGGLFKTPKVAQKILASALNVPIATMETATEGGAWGIALLASYLDYADQSLEQYLDNYIFSYSKKQIEYPDKQQSKGYQRFIQDYQQRLDVVRLASSMNKE